MTATAGKTALKEGAKAEVEKTGKAAEPGVKKGADDVVEAVA